MSLKYVVPKMDKVFGDLEFAQLANDDTKRVNGQVRTVSRTYNLFSPIRKEGDLQVTIPSSVGKKTFEYMDNVKVVNPRLIAVGKSSGNNYAYTDYVLEADDIVKA